jgi:hypothetical protein
MRFCEVGIFCITSTSTKKKNPPKNIFLKFLVDVKKCGNAAEGDYLAKPGLE